MLLGDALDLAVVERLRREPARELVVRAHVRARFSRELEPPLAGQGRVGVERLPHVQFEVRCDRVVVASKVVLALADSTWKHDF